LTAHCRKKTAKSPPGADNAGATKQKLSAAVGKGPAEGESGKKDRPSPGDAVSDWKKKLPPKSDR